MHTEIKHRKPAGPKHVIPGRRTINVGLTEDNIEQARKLGRGNISAGLRLALMLVADGQLSKR